MIELNSKTQQDFLNRKWVQRLLDAGVDMSDAKYFINKKADDPFIRPEDQDYVFYKDEIIGPDFWYKDSAHVFDEIKYTKKKAGEINYQTHILPTYTVSELLYKLHEWVYPTIDGVEYSGGLKLLKDAPFYITYYHLENKDKTEWNEDLYADFEYPIESLASLLIQCHEKGLGDVGNISNK